jgi:hypothetical protein
MYDHEVNPYQNKDKREEKRKERRITRNREKTVLVY